MPQRMTPLDAAFLDIEDEDRHASMAIASVAVLEGSVPDQDEFVQALAGKLPLVPRYRQKPRTMPFDLGRPVWVDDGDFDIRYHVRRPPCRRPATTPRCAGWWPGSCRNAWTGNGRCGSAG
jgi:diacylglycerol O-acyltransferase